MEPEREPDHTEDPRDADVGQGYPEEAQPGASPGGGAAERNEAEAGDAPDTSSSEEGEPGRATGNPDAAGG